MYFRKLLKWVNQWSRIFVAIPTNFPWAELWSVISYLIRSKVSFLLARVNQLHSFMTWSNFKPAPYVAQSISVFSAGSWLDINRREGSQASNYAGLTRKELLHRHPRRSHILHQRYINPEQTGKTRSQPPRPANSPPTCPFSKVPWGRIYSQEGFPLLGTCTVGARWQAELWSMHRRQQKWWPKGEESSLWKWGKDQIA